VKRERHTQREEVKWYGIGWFGSGVAMGMAALGAVEHTHHILEMGVTCTA
jgi:hypothetical protein